MYSSISKKELSEVSAYFLNCSHCLYGSNDSERRNVQSELYVERWKQKSSICFLILWHLNCLCFHLSMCNINNQKQHNIFFIFFVRNPLFFLYVIQTQQCLLLSVWNVNMYVKFKVLVKVKNVFLLKKCVQVFLLIFPLYCEHTLIENGIARSDNLFFTVFFFSAFCRAITVIGAKCFDHCVFFQRGHNWTNVYLL